MSVFNTHSDIAEVRDQLSLDHADGKYLNVVSANLGIQRPPFGFSDDTWRALAKVLSLQYKQIRTKFEAVLTIILGPKVTQVGAFAEPCLAGDRHAVLTATEQFPQIGTMVIDEGLPTEETIDYCYIDRYSKTVYFTTPLQQDHTPLAADWETSLVSDVVAGAIKYSVFDASGFPDPSTYTYPVVIGRGTEYETVGQLTALDRDARWIEGPALGDGGLGADTAYGNTVTHGPIASQENVYYLTLQDVSKLSAQRGQLRIPLANALSATGGSTTTVTVAGPLTDHVYGGYWVYFDGNVTAGLAGAIGYVLDNTSTTITFANTLPDTPAAGDTFRLLANIEYIRADVADNSVLMKREFPDLQTVAANTVLTVLRPQLTAACAQVQVKGVGWEVYQTSPRDVEILLPSVLLESNLRSASYIRDSSLAGTADASADRAAGSTDLAVLTTEHMPLIGVLEHAAESTRYAYYTPHAWITEEALAGATSIKVTDTSQFLTSGTLLIAGSPVLYSVTDTTTLTTGALPADVGRGTLVQDAFRFRLVSPTLHAVTTADTLNFYTNYSSGDIWDVEDVWPGPYVWDIFSEIHKQETNPGNTATQNLSGPTYLSVDRIVGATVFEVEDASTFPTAVPFNVLLGENSGNVETLAVQEVSLKSRTHTTLSGDIAAGVTSVPVAALAGPVAPLNTFPDGGPYRVVIAPFTATAEVVEVLSTGTLTLELSQPTAQAHTTGDAVVLLSDLLRVSPAASDDHTGRILSTDRFGLYARESQVSSADMVRPLYSTVTLTLSAADFSTEAGTAILNFGNRLNPVKARLAATLSSDTAQLDDTSVFPTSGYPYVVYVDVGAGPLKQEALHVINNDTDTNELTFSHAPVFSHPEGRLVEFRPGLEENISYTSNTSGTLTFTPYLQIEGTHYAVEYLAPSVGTGFPRDNGYDFPLRLPVTVEDRIRFMVDLVRAAGVEVTFISKR